MSGISVQSALPTPSEIASRVPCKRGAQVHDLQSVQDTTFTLGSLVFDCSDYSEVFNCLMSSSSKSINVEPIIALNQRAASRSQNRCRHSFYSLLFSSFTAPEFASQISQANLHIMLGLKITSELPVEIDALYKDKVIEDWLLTFSSLQRIGIAISKNSEQASVKLYNTIVKETVPHSYWIQNLIEESILLRCGPLMNLATKLTTENISYVMKKLNLVTSISCIQSLFCSPSVMGKCTALVQLLEVHGILWQSVNLEIFEDFIPTMYTIIEWLFEKCNQGKIAILDGIKWVKAKFRRSENEPDKYPGLRTDLPETSNVEVVEAHAIEPVIEIKLVTLEKFLQNIRQGITAKAETLPKVESYTNSCFFEALSQGINEGISYTELRDRCLEYLHEHCTELTKYMEENMFLDPGSSLANVAQEMDEVQNGMPTSLFLIYVMEQVLQKKILVVQRRSEEGKDVYVLHSTNDAYEGDPIWIWFIPGHYLLGSKCKFDMTRDLGGINELKYVVESGESYFQIGEQEIKISQATPSEIKDIISPPIQKVDEMVPMTNMPDREVEAIVESLEGTKTGRSFLEWLKEMGQNVMRFFKENAIIGGITAFCFSIVSGLGMTVSTFKSSGDKVSFWKNISNAGRDFYYLNRGQDTICKVFTDFAKTARDMLGMDDEPEITAFKEALVESAQSAEDMNNMCVNQPEKVVNDPQKLYELKKIIDNVRARYIEITKMSSGVNLAGLAPIWRRLTVAYTQLDANYAQICNRTEIRPRPVCVWIWGKSNIGKTEYAAEFVNKLNLKRGTAWETFTVSKGPDFLNGFRQQKIIRIDDFDSFSMQEGCLDALLVMNMVSTAPYNPNMAALEEKNLQAKPALIIICSNFETAKLNCGVNDMTAFERRRDFLIKATWPGPHEACDAATIDCEHWETVKKKATNIKEGEGLNFDHLKFERENPLVYSNKTCYSKMPSVVKRHGACEMPKGKTQKIGDITTESLLEQVCKRLDDCEQVYKVSVERLNFVKKRALESTQVKAQSAESLGVACVDWNQTPNIIFKGQPGTGKSATMKKIYDQLVVKHGKSNVTYITTVDAYNSLGRTDWKCGNAKFVLFDDFSTWKKSSLNERFWTLWKQRADLGDAKQPVWILGVNEDVAISTFNTIEEYEVLTRSDRATSFEFSFRPVNQGLFGFFMTVKMYTSDDMKDTNVPYEQKVKIECGKEELANCQVVARVVDWSPDRQQHFEQVTLPKINTLDIDALSIMTVSSTEFISMINTPGNSKYVVDLITGSKYQSSGPRKLDKGVMGKKLWCTFRELRALNKLEFKDMDEFMLVGSNADFFKRFEGHNCVMKFTDVSYALYTYAGRVFAARYDPLNAVEDLAKISDSIVQSINTFDFLKVCRSTLPPWFIAGSAVLEAAVKFFLTGAAMYSAISQNKLMYKAMTMKTQLDEVQDKYMDHSLEQIAVEQKNALMPTQNTHLAPTIIANSPSSTSSEPDQKHSKWQAMISMSRGRRGGKKHAKKVKGQNASSKEEVIAEIVDSLVEMHPEMNESPLIVPEIANDEGVFDVANAIYPNLLDIRTLDNKHVVSAIALYGNVATTVGHLSSKYSDAELTAVDIKGNRLTIKFTHRDQNIDRVDFTFSGTAKRDIRKHLCSGGFKMNGSKVALMINMMYENEVPILMARLFRVKSNEQKITLAGFYDVQAYSYVSAVSSFSTEIPVQTKAGDCGGVVLLCDSSAQRKIIGLHIGSCSNSSYFRILASEHYALGQMGNIEGPFGEFTKPAYPQKDGFEIVAKCRLRPHIPTKTKLYRSPFAYGDCQYQPSVLSSEDPRCEIDDLLYKESMKWCKPREPSPFSQERFNEIFRIMGDYFGQKLAFFDIETSVLTKSTALNRLTEYTHSKGIVVGTSPGYPFNVVSEHGKSEFIKVDEFTGERKFTSDIERKQKLHAGIDHILKRADEGKTADVAFTVFPKDELLKKEKLKTKTRTIAAAPLHLVIALRMYFHSVNAAIAELWHLLPFKNGMAFNSLDWHALATYLCEVGTEGFSLDQKDFDFNILAEINRAVVEFDIEVAKQTNQKLTQKDIKRMRWLRENIVLFYYIVNGLVYQATGGVASGQPSTTNDNSKISLGLLYIAFQELCPTWLKSDFATFMRLVRVAVIGDDLIVIINDMIKEWFNLQTVAEFLNKNLYLNVTPSDKSNVFYTTKPLEELDFVSRNFKQLNGYWVGPLKMERLTKPFHFCHGSRAHDWFKEQDAMTDRISEAIQAASSGLQEMFFHGEEEYERCRRHCVDVIRNNFATSEAYFPPYSTEYANLFDMPTYTNRGLYSYDFPISHEIVPKLTQYKEWIKYSNRRSLNFGNYFWDKKSKEKIIEMPAFLQRICERVNRTLDTSFNSCLVNEYPKNGHIPFHQDNEKMLDLEEGVACVTVIGDGEVHWAEKKDGQYFINMRLPCYPGHLYHMTGKFVKEFYHRRIGHSRYTISLTFRRIDSSE
uniref:SF3 helicase domain-containing protein n=1 Tax=Picornavirales sp. TaxID=1955153 RepID=A0A6M3YNU8_9VIRU|nr:MAG: hypothetical protein 1 [Picornavirales sp.]